MLAEGYVCSIHYRVPRGFCRGVSFPGQHIRRHRRYFILHHAGRPAKVLEEAFRVLRRDGRVGFTVWADPSRNRRLSACSSRPWRSMLELRNFLMVRCSASATSTGSTRCSVRPGFVPRRSENSQRSGGCGRSIPSWLRFETERSRMRFRMTFEAGLKQRCGTEPARTDPATALQCRIRRFFCRQ